MTRTKMFFAFFLAALLAVPSLSFAADKKMPAQGEIANMIRVSLVDFSDAVKSGDTKPVLSKCTKEFQLIFTEKIYKILMHQFIEKKITFYQVKDVPLFYMSAPYFDNFGDLMIKGFFIQDKSEDNLVTFELSYHWADSSWLMNSFGFRTFPKKGLPSGEQLKELVSTDVILFNDALKSGDFSKFREALTKSMKEGSTPETLKQNFSALNNNKKYAQNVAADKIYFEDYPDLIGSEYLIVKVRYPLDGNQAGFVAMSFSFKKEEGKWKIGDVRAGVQTGG